MSDADASEVLEAWSCLHFSVANPRSDAPPLAGCIEEWGIDAADMLDVTIGSEVTEDGPWCSASGYWAPDSPTVEP